MEQNNINNKQEEKKEYLIWSNGYDHVQAIFDDLREDEEYDDYDDDKLEQYAYELNDEYLHDEQLNLNKNIGRQIVAFINTQVWNGRGRSAEPFDTNIKSIFNITKKRGYDRFDFVGRPDNSDIIARMAHHDGTHELIFRVLKEGVTERDACMAWINKEDDKAFEMTDSLFPYIADIYGWS